MSKTYKCDHCGKFKDGYPKRSVWGEKVAVTLDTQSSISSIPDLCPDCFAALLARMANALKEDIKEGKP